ncbi:MAG: glycerophosphodiester phosphodiesterase [Elusimicrobiota bacterium]
MKKILFPAFAVLLFSCAAARAVEVHGHRGTRGTRPENTLPAFAEALRAGVDVLEMDMGVTKDDVIVISHEPYITPERCLDAAGKPPEKPLAIRSLTLEEVKKYDCGSLPHPKFPEQVLVPGARIPALEEVFALAEAFTQPAAAKVQFNIETKIFPSRPELTPAPAEFAKLVAGIVKKHGLEKRVIVQSFDVRTLKAMKRLAPAIRTSQLTYEELVDIVPALKSAKADIWSPDYTWMTADSIKEAHAAGLQVAPWTLNAPADWDLAIAQGADAIITDYPAALIEHLKARKLR